MATANELLAMVADSGVDKTLIIDNDLRTIIIPKSVANLGTEADKDVHRLQFQMPRYLGDIDLSELNIRINYMNANKQGDIYVVIDKKVLSSTITFSWLVGAHALMYKGAVKFIVCLKKSDSEGNVLKEFNTTVATLPVLEGLEVDASYLGGELYDVLEQLQSLTESKVSEVESAGAEQITKVSAKSVEEQENIVNKGAEVLATIPEDYRTTTKLANEGVRTKADAIVCSTTGEAVVVNDSSDDNLRGLSIFGKSTQFSTTGAQLISTTLNVSKDVVGLTISPLTNGEIVVNGTYTEGVPWVEFGRTSLIAGKTYTLSCSEDFSIHLWDLTNSKEFRTKKLNVDSIEIEATESIDCGVVLNGVWVDKTYSNAKISVMLNEGSSALPWEPYTGGIPSPNPDYPQEIVSIENPTIDIYGKNLLDVPEHFTFNDVTGIDVYLPAGDYILSFENETHEGASHPEFRFYDNKIWNTIVDTVKSRVVTITKPETKIYVYTNGTSSTNSKGVSATINKLMLSKVSGDYESYKPVQTIPVDHTLPAIPVASGGNYTDSDGQQWICDEIDFERGVYVQRIYAETFDASNVGNWWEYTSPGYEGYARTVPNMLEGVRWNGYSNVFRAHTAGGSEPGMWIGAGNNVLYLHNVIEWFPTLDYFKDWVSANPFVVVYPIANPIETPLTADEIAAFQTLRSNYPNTTVLNDSGATMKLKYNADTETWIKNLIDERIATAIANIQ